MDTVQASSEPALAFPPKGALRRFAFPKLVREIARGKVTGSLYLLSGQTKKVVFFEEGQPVFVRSNVLSECLGQVLSSEGLITQEQCEQTLEAIRRTGKKQGELLVEMGILSEGNLRYGLAAQLRAKLYDIFAWDDGRYQFKSDTATNGSGVRLDARPEAVIIGAILDRYDEARAEKLLESSMGDYLVYGEDAPLDVGDLDLLGEERYFVECIDGSRTVAQCVRDELAQSVPNPHALVYGLVQAGVADLAKTALETRPRPAKPNFDARPNDETLTPGFEPHNVITEYEDTPLPGELPQMRALLGDHEDDFADVEALETGTSVGPVPAELSTPAAAAASPASPTAQVSQVSQELIAAEPDQVEETFDDAELREEISGPSVAEPPPTSDDDVSAASPAANPPEDDDGLVDPLEGLELDDLDDIDIEAEPDLAPEADVEPDPATETELDLESDIEIDADLDTDIELEEEPDPEPPVLEPDPDPEPEPDPEPTPEPPPELMPEPVAELHEDDDVLELEEVDDLDDVDEVDDLDELDDLDDLDDLDEPEPTEPPLVDLSNEDPGATRADPLPPMAVNRDLATPRPLDPDPEDDDLDLDPDLDPDLDLDLEPDLEPELGPDLSADFEPDLDPNAALPAASDDGEPAEFDVDDDLLLADGGDDLGDLLPVDDLGELDEIDLGMGDDLQVDDDLAFDDLDPDAPLDGSADATAAPQPEPEPDDSLVDLDDLDDVELAAPGPAASPPSAYTGPEATFEDSQDPEMVGAMRFNEAETALGEQRFPDAVALLESAYDNGFDVAELHAMLAYSRFMAAGQDLETAQHAFELLEYSESMDPSLDLVWAYRGSLHNSLGDTDQARSALGRALELNPYCELAIQLMDELG